LVFPVLAEREREREKEDQATDKCFRPIPTALNNVRASDREIEPVRSKAGMATSKQIRLAVTRRSVSRRRALISQGTVI
jgi:hypothetical protein